jgi:hypothetical protein
MTDEFKVAAVVSNCAAHAAPVAKGSGSAPMATEPARWSAINVFKKSRASPPT